MPHLRSFLCLFISLLVLSGCAQTYTWTKPGANQAEYYRASSYCQALATGATPMDYSNSGTSTTYHSGTVYGSGGGSAYYSGTSTTYNNNTGQAIANLGKSIQRQNLFNDCMRGRGFQLEKDPGSSFSADHFVTQKAEGWTTSSPDQQTFNSGSAQDHKKPLSRWKEEASSVKFATVTEKEIQLLAQPALNAESFATIPKNTTLIVLGEAQFSWFKVGYESKVGFVMQRWLTPTESGPKNESIEDYQRVENFEGRIATVGNDAVEIRWSPRLEAPVKGKLNKGQKVLVLQAPSQNWFEVKAENVDGFLLKSNIEFVD